MSDLKYTVIRDDKQYFQYCEVLQEMAFSKDAAKLEDEMDLLTLLIKEYDNRDKVFVKSKRDPVMVIKSLMEINNETQQDISNLLKVSKGYISEILNYKKRLSSEGIRVVADHFAIQQEALNRDYELIKQNSPRRRQKYPTGVRSYKTGKNPSSIIIAKYPARDGNAPKQYGVVRSEKPSKGRIARKK